MKTERTDKLDRQELAIPILLTCRTRIDACKKIGITKETLSQWFKEDEFVTKYRRAQREVYDHAMALLIALVDDAVQSLREVLEGTASPAIKVQAANAILGHAKSHCMDMELEDRVIELEKKLAEMAKEN